MGKFSNTSSNRVKKKGDSKKSVKKSSRTKDCGCGRRRRNK